MTKAKVARIGVGWLLAATGGLACGGFGPGDYVIYRVAFEPSRLESDCFDGEVPPSVAEDQSSFGSAGTFILYFDEGEQPRLDTGKLVLSGSGDDDAYSFEGNSLDTEVVPGQTIVDTDRDGINDSEDPVVDADMDDIEDAFDTLVDTDGDGVDDRSDPLVDADGDGEDDRYVQLPSNTKLVSNRNVKVDLTLAGDLLSGGVRVVTSSRCEGDCTAQPDDSQCTTVTPFSGVRIEDADVNVESGTAPFD